jgi:tRNA-binding EMAP/Myf-like protein
VNSFPIELFLVDVGEEKPRTVVSGLVKHIPIEKMQVGSSCLKIISLLKNVVCLI